MLSCRHNNADKDLKCSSVKHKTRTFFESWLLISQKWYSKTDLINVFGLTSKLSLLTAMTSLEELEEHLGISSFQT